MLGMQDALVKLSISILISIKRRFMPNGLIQEKDKNKCNTERKVALLGDSIFDNESYVLPGEAVIDQVNLLDKVGWSAELLAVDGAVTKDVSSQCERVTEDMTHIVVSIGGNNALGYISVFEKNISSVYEGMQVLAAIKDQFQKSYQEMLKEVVSLDMNLVLCTIYNTCPGVEIPLLTALSVFNDVIFHEAFKLGVPVLDFRQTFNNPSDYSSVSPIEPSEAGGVKIAKVLQNLMELHDFSTKRSVVYH
ncbi:MAG: hypothetical protein ACI8ZB_003811 [Desulforhopalus sp.]|jgi:hypothetical protein